MPRMTSNVDFPAPEGPMMVINSPSAMLRVIWRSTYVNPAFVLKHFSISRSWIMDVFGPVGVGSGAVSSVPMLICLIPDSGFLPFVSQGFSELNTWDRGFLKFHKR